MENVKINTGLTATERNEQALQAWNTAYADWKESFAQYCDEREKIYRDSFNRTIEDLSKTQKQCKLNGTFKGFWLKLLHKYPFN